MSYNAFV